MTVTLKIHDFDLEFAGGRISLVDGVDKIAQDIKVLLLTYYGEDPFDPSWGSLLEDVETYDEALLKRTIEHAVFQHPDVERITNIQFTYDSENRQLTIDLQVRLKSGADVEVNVVMG